MSDYAEGNAPAVVWDGHGVAHDGTAFRDSIACDDLGSRVQP